MFRFLKENSKLITLIFLVSLYPLLFIASNNFNSFSLIELFFSVLILFSIINIGLLLTKFILQKAFNLSESLSLKITYGLLLVVFLVMMRHSVFNNPELAYLIYLKSHSVYSKWLLFCSFAAVFFFIGFSVFAKQAKPLIMILLLLNLFNFWKIISPLLMQDHSKETSNFTKVEIKDKKNVYFILTDSLTNLNGLELLGIKKDNSEFLDDLSNKGFTHYPAFFTSLQATQNALFTYFNLSYMHQGVNAYQSDPILRMRQVLTEGKVYDIFRKNGYKINILHELDVFLLDDCIADQCYFNVSNKQREASKAPNNMLIKIVSILSFVSPIDLNELFNFKFKKQILFFDPKELDLNDRNEFISGTIRALKNLDLSYPNFTYIHAFTFPAHSANSDEVMGRCNEKNEIHKYNERIKYTSKFVLSMIDTIRTRDKNSIIIIAGDHGPYIFRKCTREGIRSPKGVVERQGAFLSILWGDDYDGKFDKNIKSSHNLFRYVLSYLANNDELLKEMDKDDAFTFYNNLQVGQTITDGIINKKIVIVSPQKNSA